MAYFWVVFSWSMKSCNLSSAGCDLSSHGRSAIVKSAFADPRLEARRHAAARAKRAACMEVNIVKCTQTIRPQRNIQTRFQHGISSKLYYITHFPVHVAHAPWGNRGMIVHGPVYRSLSIHDLRDVRPKCPSQANA